MSETESALPQKAERSAQIDASLTTAKKLVAYFFGIYLIPRHGVYS